MSVKKKKKLRSCTHLSYRWATVSGNTVLPNRWALVWTRSTIGNPCPALCRATTPRCTSPRIFDFSSGPRLEPPSIIGVVPHPIIPLHYLPVTFELYGLPLMCLSPNLTETLYSPGAVGRYVTDTVPSLLSWQLISALLGPSTANDSPPGKH